MLFRRDFLHILNNLKNWFFEEFPSKNAAVYQAIAALLAGLFEKTLEKAANIAAIAALSPALSGPTIL